LRAFVVLPQWAPETLALWILHTYAFQLRDVTTYIGIESPEHRCGKSTLVTVLSELAHRAIVASNVSSPAFFRVIEQLRPALSSPEERAGRGGPFHGAVHAEEAFVIR
jgi:putative DNA primase/helicase